MSRSWLIDCKGIATKVKNARLSPAYQIKDCGAKRECPKCHHRIDNSDVSHEWPGFPAGVKFDPSDVELLEHLAAKCGVANTKPHMLIDEFIPTVDNEEGICYTHPETLPGAKKDGSSVHFFHKTTNAYATGQRKRRKIHNQHSLTKEDVRWHKTGKTKPVIENGVQKGYKKIMVLYRISKKASKPDKSNWVMHQYHLGINEDEVEGQYVVSRIFYQQQKQSDSNDSSLVIKDSDNGTIRYSPRTPKTNTPTPPRAGKSVSCDDVTDDYAPASSAQVLCASNKDPTPSLIAPEGAKVGEHVSFSGQGGNPDVVLNPKKKQLETITPEAEIVRETSHPSSSAPQFKDDMETHTWLAGESQAVDGSGVDDSLLCNEIFNSYADLDDSGLNGGPFNGFGRVHNDIPGAERNVTCGIADLENLELDTPPDFQLADLQFGSQDSILGWLDRL